MGVKIDKSNIEDVYAMSDIQKGMVYHSLKDADAHVYHNQTVYQWKDNEFDSETFKKALMLLVEKHPILRTGFRMLDFEEPIQIVYKKVSFDIQYIDIAHMNKREQEECIKKFMAEDRQRGFNVTNASTLWRVKIFTLGNENHCLMWICHHAIMDGWSSASLTTELYNAYLRLKVDPDFVPQKIKSTYKDFAIEQDVEKKKKKNIDYWRKKLYDYKRLDFSGIVSNTKHGKPGERKNYSKKFTSQLFTDLNHISKKLNTSVKNVCFGAYIYMLNMLTYVNDIVVGLVTHNRPLCEDGDKILGCFLNTVPFRVKIPMAITWLDYLRVIDNSLRELAKYNRYSLLEIVKIIGDDTRGRNPIFDTIFTFTDFHIFKQLDKSSTSTNQTKNNPSLDIEKHVSTNTYFDFFVNITYGEFIIFANYNDSIISEEWVIRLFGYYEQILNHLIYKPDHYVNNENLMPVEEKQKLLYYFNETEAGYPKNKTIHELFAEQVEKVPDDPALIFETTTFTYRKLNEESNRLAWILREQGIGAENIAAMLIHRSVDMIVAILGILKAGAAYLPIEPGYPEQRIKFMLEDSSAGILLTKPDLSGEITFGKEILHLPDAINSVTTPHLHLAPAPGTSLAYIIYTSGTTGQPKGVMIEHKNVVRLMVNDKNLFDFNGSDVWTMFHSYCFDFSVWEMYGALLYGGKLVVIPGITAKDPLSYLEILRKQEVTILNQTPSAFYNLINEEIKQKEKNLKIRCVIFGGEALKPAKLKPWILKYPGTKLVNMFGITEATVHVTYKEITHKEIEHDISNIGKPISTTTCYVMDSNRNLLPIGAAGELCVGGDGVGRGYLKRQELTREKFVNNPFKTGERLYRSGDLVRMLENGEMEYLGRLDHQVQLRGFRIELGEIENQLLKHHKITEALVKAKVDEKGNRYLCAYYVSISGQLLVPAQLREYLSGELPDYMIPSYFVPIEKIPLTPNGKIDVKALPQPGFSLENGNDNVAPRSEAEEQLAEIWQKVLSLEKIGIKDSYFNVGGDSIKAIKLVNEINETMETDIKIADLYVHDTIEKLSGRIAQSGKLESDQREKQEVLQQIEAMKNRILNCIQNPGEIEDLYPMSDIEKGMVFYYMKHAGTGIYHDQFVYPLRYTNFEPRRFYNAFVLMAAKHDALRTSFNIDDFEEPVKIIYKEPRLEIKDFNISRLKQTQQEEFIKNQMEADRKNPFEAADYPLWRMRIFILDEENIIVLFIFNHAILDGWSVASLAVELHNTYMELEKNPGFVPVKLKTSYKEVVVNEMLEKQCQETIDYWKNELAGYKRLELLNTAKISGDVYQPMVTCKHVFPPGWREKLQHTAAQYHTSFNHLCLGAYLYLVNMFSYENDIVIGKVTNNRPLSEDGHKVLGCFLNTVPLRIQIPISITAADYIRTVENKLKEIKKYEWMSLFEIARAVGEKSEDRNPIFDTLYNFMDFHVLKEARPQEKIGERTGDKKEVTGSTPLVVTGSQDTNTLFDFEIDTTADNFTLVPKYNRTAISDEMVEKLCVYYQRIIDMLILHPQRLLEKAEIIPGEERRRVLYEFNDTRAVYPEGKTIPLMLEEQTARTPDNIAVICDDGKEILYRELNQRANRLARELKQKGIGPGHLVALIIDRSIEMIAAVIGILKAGGAYVPIEPYLHGERIGKLLTNLSIEIVITNPQQLEKLSEITKKLPGIRHTLCLEFQEPNRDEIDGESLENLKPGVTPQDPAYVIFTSGSTGVPKGVMVKHQPVINVIQWVNREFAVGPADKILFITSLGFDLSVYDIFGILSSGAGIRLVSAGDIKEPRRLLEIIMQEGITFWDSAPAALQQLVPFFPEVKNYHEESRLRLVFMSGDWIPVTLPDILKETFTGIKVISLGGATEATIWSNYYPIHRVDPSWKSIPYGKPIENAAYYILDRELSVCPIGVAGDLYIGGQCLATAYVNDVELTVDKFIANPYIPGEKIYKTGDISRWYADGNMEFLGRKDQQVKIRGYRVELGEIESHLSKYPGIKESIVIVRETKGNRYLCAYYISAGEPEREKIRDYLSKQLPEYMVPGHFVHLDEIPLTPNGKLNRKALPEPETTKEEEYMAPRDDIEHCLVDIWSGVLGVEKTIIGINSNFFELGGHSLNSTSVISKIHKELNVKVPLKEIFRSSTIGELSAYIKEQTEEKYAPINPAEKKDYYVLSSAQRRLFILQQLEPANVGYNIPQVNMIEGSLKVETVEAAFRQMIDTQEVLRTAIETIQGEPFQRVYETVDFKVIYQETNEEKAKDIFNTFVRPFDLSKAPFLRVELIKIGAARHVLLFDMHHIISDGVSNQLFLNQLFSLYAGRLLPSLPIQYKDYAQWQNSKKQREKIARQQKYWVNEFAGEIPVLNLPTDYPRPSIQSFEGSSIDFTLKPGDTEALIRIAKSVGGTLFMVLLALYNILLAKLTGEENIAVGTPIAGRRHLDLENLIGMFVNTLVLRNYPVGTKNFKTFLREIKNKTLMSFENQDYQFEELVEQVAVNRDMSRNPLFDVMFTLQNIKIQMDQDLNIQSDLRVLPYETNNTTSKFDLTLTAVEGNNELFFTIEYCTKLFKKETIHRLIQYFKKITKIVIQAPHQLLSEIDVLSSEEKNRLLFEFNDTAAGYPFQKNLHQLFAKQAERTPDHVAIVGTTRHAGRDAEGVGTQFNPSGSRDRDVYITYDELNETSNQLAHRLTAKGVKTDTIAAIMVERSVEMIRGILGILKSGGAYLPIDPEYPEERIKYMLRDSSAKILVTDHGLYEKFEKLLMVNSQVLMVNEKPPGSRMLNTPSKEASSHLHQSPAPVTSLAYIIYTSGTTGSPKGVMITHENVVRLMSNDRFLFDFHNGDVWTMFHAYNFDFSVWEMYGALLYGGKLVIIPKMIAKDPKLYLEILEKKNVTILNQTPSAFYNLIEEELNHQSKRLSLRYVIFGGEALHPVKLKEWKEKYPTTRLINMFGITETTVHVTYKEIDTPGISSGISNIGKPLPTLTTYVLDKDLKILPIGAAGELIVGGKGLARGYLNQPELTTVKFVQHPYQGEGRVYRSGDLARFSENGEMEYLGRIDRQVQVRGFRIELGEIESQLLKHEKIEGAVVLLKEKNQDKYLCAYIISKEDLKIPGLREHLAISLPGYMLPAQFIKIDKIPLTPNGKVDKKTLLSYDTKLETGKEYTSPKSKTEKIIAGIWKEVLNLEKVSIHDNIFDLGGDSLKIIKINSRIKDKLKEDIPLLMLFRYSTIHSLSDYFTRKKVETVKMKTTEVEELDRVEETMKDTIQLFDELGGY